MPADAGRQKIKIGVIRASGYTGADLIRLAACHPFMELTLLAANTMRASRSRRVPHLGCVQAPPLVKAERRRLHTPKMGEHVGERLALTARSPPAR